MLHLHSEQSDLTTHGSSSGTNSILKKPHQADKKSSNHSVRYEDEAYSPDPCEHPSPSVSFNPEYTLSFDDRDRSATPDKASMFAHPMAKASYSYDTRGSITPSQKGLREYSNYASEDTPDTANGGTATSRMWNINADTYRSHTGTMRFQHGVSEFIGDNTAEGQKHILRFLRPMKNQLNYITANQMTLINQIQIMQIVMIVIIVCLSLLVYADIFGTSLLHWDDKNPVRIALYWVMHKIYRYIPFIIFFNFVAFRFPVACHFLWNGGLVSLLFYFPEPTCIGLALWVTYNYYNWQNEFRPRFQRSERQCYANGSRPMVADVAGHYNIRMAERSKPPIFRTTTYRLGQRKDQHRTKKKFLHDMDHIHIPFWPYLWLCLFVTPNAVSLMFFGNLYWRARQIMIDWNLITPKKKDQAEVLANLTLKTSQVRNFQRIETIDGRTVGIFLLKEFDMLNGDNKCERVEYLEWHIDLDDVIVIDNKFKLKKDKEERKLQIGDLLCLLYYQNVSSNHVQGHTFANWGTDNESPNPFIRRMSNITIIYNYFGRTVFVGLTHFLHWIGFSKYGHTDFGKTVQSGLDTPIVNHGNIRQLAKYSVWVHFITQLRSRFLEEFEAACHSGDFGMVDGEALFVGTVIHSLDHLELEKCVDEATWFTCNTKEFEPMQWCCRVVRAGFVDDIPAISFSFSFKDAPEGFYSKVYRHARQIDRFYADNIYCCIIK